MPCDHAGPAEVIALAERELRARDLPDYEWSGRSFRHAENTPGGTWASVVIEIERRGDEWIVTRLDRKTEPVPEDHTGLVEIAQPGDETVRRHSDE